MTFFTTRCGHVALERPASSQQRRAADPYIQSVKLESGDCDVTWQARRPSCEHRHSGFGCRGRPFAVRALSSTHAARTFATHIAWPYFVVLSLCSLAVPSRLSLLLSQAQEMIQFLLLQNRQGKTRLSKYYKGFSDEERTKMETDIHRIVTTRDPKFTNFVEVSRKVFAPALMIVSSRFLLESRCRRSAATHASELFAPADAASHTTPIRRICPLPCPPTDNPRRRRLNSPVLPSSVPRSRRS